MNIMFWICAVLWFGSAVFGAYMADSPLPPINIARQFLDALALLGLYGLAYRKRILNVVFWRVLLPISVSAYLAGAALPKRELGAAERDLVTQLKWLALRDDGTYSMQAVWALIGASVLLLALHLFPLVGVFLYAFRRPGIWARE